MQKHFMTHDMNYVDTLLSEEQVKREFVTTKGNRSHIFLLHLLRSGLIVAQVERYVEDEVREHYLLLKSKYIDKVNYLLKYRIYFYCCNEMKIVFSVCPYLFAIVATKLYTTIFLSSICFE